MSLELHLLSIHRTRPRCRHHFVFNHAIHRPFLLATLPFLSGLVEAGCTNVGGGVGGNPLKCTSYDAPRNVGSSVNGPLNSLTISRVEDDTKFPDWRFYTFKNNMNYDINFAVQFWNPNTQQVSRVLLPSPLSGNADPSARTTGKPTHCHLTRSVTCTFFLRCKISS